MLANRLIVGIRQPGDQRVKISAIRTANFKGNNADNALTQQVKLARLHRRVRSVGD
ncbi:hypothetical protein D3C79_519350 [compost metagenome]